LFEDESGLTTVEYALVLAIVVVAGIVAWQTLGGEVGSTVNRASESFPGGQEPAYMEQNGR
jgi:Flp pilus assembly pilin Flp